jgi:hypothetical protein
VGYRERRELGEIAALAAFLEEHCEEVEADLRRWYQVRLTDLYRGALSFRELWVLIAKLPQESWTQTALRDKPTEGLEGLAPPESEQKFGPWAHADYQRAALIDAVNYLTFVLARVNGNEKFQPFDPTPKPGMNRPVRIQSDDNVRYLDNLRARGTG